MELIPPGAWAAGPRSGTLTPRGRPTKLRRRTPRSPPSGNPGVNQSWNIIIVPSDHSGTRQYTVSRGLLTALAILLTVSLLTIGIFLFDYSRALSRARTADALEVENQGLRREVATVEHLSQEIEDLTALKAQILMMLGVEGGVPDEQLAGAGAAGDSESSASDLLGVDHLKAAANLSAYAPRLWPVEGYISREFYEEEDGVEGHPGLDLVAPDGAPVKAAGRGKVIEASYDDWLGNYVVIDHGFGYSTLYGHNQRLLVSEGQSVERGQVIARLGNTGRSSAPHLHFEIRLDGRSVDPRQYLAPK